MILLTSLAKTSDILAGLRDGADAYVTRPYDPPQVLDRIDFLLAHASRPDRAGEPLAVDYAGEAMRLDVTRRQLLNLLLSTYENVLWQNSQLAEMRDRLQETGRNLEASLTRTSDLLHLVLPREIADELADRVKNRSPVEMFFLERLRPEFSADAAGTTGNERMASATLGGLAGRGSGSSARISQRRGPP